jgi:UDP-N-acetylmuramoyl-tripeptide--D-alanyl-D-alanine ligase
MEKIHAGTISGWINGKLIGNPNASIEKVGTDTRTLEKGSLFIAIRGQNFDGHQFIDQAFEKGALAVISDIELRPPPGRAVIVVKDTVKALGELAKSYLQLFNIPVIGITGSVGKTTIKDMIAQILATEYNVHKSVGNYNNHIGLPLSVLKLTREHTVAVFEMGMSGLGEIEYLSEIIKPDIGVISNIGISHIEKLGSRQNILRAKLEICKGMKKNGKLILNGDDELLSGLNGLLSMPVTYYGINENALLHAFGIESMGEDGVRFTVKLRNDDVQIVIRVPGIHNVSNALAAIACGLELGVSSENIKKGLANYSQEKMRLNIVQYNDVKVINDAYNSAPASAQAALEVLHELAGNGRTIAVLGDMLELGEYAVEAHRQVGEFAAKQGIKYLIAIGDIAREYIYGALKKGMDIKNTRYFKSGEDAAAYLKELIRPHDHVLFKGSRGMKLDKVIDTVFNKKH